MDNDNENKIIVRRERSTPLLDNDNENKIIVRRERSTTSRTSITKSKERVTSKEHTKGKEPPKTLRAAGNIVQPPLVSLRTREAKTDPIRFKQEERNTSSERSTKTEQQDGSTKKSGHIVQSTTSTERIVQVHSSHAVSPTQSDRQEIAVHDQSPQVPSGAQEESSASYSRAPFDPPAASQTRYELEATAAHQGVPSGSSEEETSARLCQTSQRPQQSIREPGASLTAFQTRSEKETTIVHQQVPHGSPETSPVRCIKKAQVPFGRQTPQTAGVEMQNLPAAVCPYEKTTVVQQTPKAATAQFSAVSVTFQGETPQVATPFSFLTPVLRALLGGPPSQGAERGHTTLDKMELQAKPNSFYYSTQLARYEELHAKSYQETDKLGIQLNMVFLRRLMDIECKAGGDAELKIITYQEWVDALNKCIIDTAKNMECCRIEINQLLEDQYRKICTSNNQAQAVGSEVGKLKGDIELLKQALCNAYENDDWDMTNLQFETLDGAQILESCHWRRSSTQSIDVLCSNPPEKSTRGFNESGEFHHDMAVNARALAIEIANKHDENCMLKRQICCLEDDVQKAQQKLQLKDDVIAQLRGDLRLANGQVLEEQQKLQCKDDVIAKLRDDLRCSNAQIRFLEDQLSRGTSPNQREELTQMAGTGTIKFVDLSAPVCSKVSADRSTAGGPLSQNSMQMYRDPPLHGPAQNFECPSCGKCALEKTKAEKELQRLRHFLSDLNFDLANDADSLSGCDSGVSALENDDRQLDSIRRRYRNFKEDTLEEKHKMQSAISNLAERDEKFGLILKEIADQISKITGRSVTYYRGIDYTSNPFVEAICNLNQQHEKYVQNLERVISERDAKIRFLEDQLSRGTSPNQREEI